MNRKSMCKVLRAIHNLTIDDVAKELYTSRKSIYRYETGDYKFETDIIIDIDNYYKRLIKKSKEKGLL